MANNLPISANYTNRDFYSLRDDLISRVQTRVAENGKQWTATDPADFGVALVEAFAYVGDITNYYIDRVANEGYLGTATQRQSLLDISSLFGYTPAGYRQASVSVTFANYDTVAPALIPAGTQITVDIAVGSAVTQLIYTVSQDVAVNAATDANTPGTAVGVATHGFNVDSLPANAANPANPLDRDGELLTDYSSGFATQEFTLQYPSIVDGSVEIYVENGGVYSQWKQVQHITDFGPTDSVYTLSSDANDYVTVTFGDGVSGAIPTTGSSIKAAYVVGGGLVGNIEGGQSFNISYVPAASGLSISSLANISIYTDPTSSATGGDDPESNDTIRTNAPAAIRTLKRAVTLQDYQDLALSVQNVGKAFAKATQPNSVALYVAPLVSDVSQDYYPGFDAANIAVTSGWTELKDSVVNYFSDKTQIGVEISVLPPTYIPAKIDIQYNLQTGYDHNQIVNSLKYAVVYGYGYAFLDFNQVIYPEQIESSLMLTPGVKSLKAIHLYRAADSASRSTLVPTNGEYFVFRDENINVYPIASLSSLTSSSGTLSPAFQSQNFNYSITGVSTSTITLTPTSWDNTCTITVNGSAVTSGSASGSIATPTGTTTKITVVVTTADSLSSNTYTLSVTR